MGCTSWMVKELGAGITSTSLAINEIFASFNQVAPIALVPQGDPFTFVNGVSTLAQLNAYRVGVNQPISFNFTIDGSTKTYCNNLINTGAPRLIKNMNHFATFPSPDPNMNLYDFLKNRFMMTIGVGGLNCMKFGLTTTLPTPTILVNLPGPTNTTTTATNGTFTPAQSGMIAGVTIAGLVVLLILIAFLYSQWFRRCYNNQNQDLVYSVHNKTVLNSKKPNHSPVERSEIV